jgi:hypothetical protein
MKNRLFPWYVASAGLLLTWLGLCPSILANPIAIPYVPGAVDPGVYIPAKQWERCLVAVDKNGATVSCAIGYALNPQKPQSHTIIFDLPVVLPESAADTEKEVLRKCAPQLEIGEEVSAPYHVQILRGASGRPYGAPEGMVVAEFRFSVEMGAGKRSATTVFTYRQPFHRTQFVYAPIFENGRDPRADAEFTLTAFPTEPGLKLSLASSNKSVRAKMQSRITVDLRQLDVIRIGVD